MERLLSFLPLAHSALQSLNCKSVCSSETEDQLCMGKLCAHTYLDEEVLKMQMHFGKCTFNIWYQVFFSRQESKLNLPPAERVTCGFN